ncbi:acyl carrier protein [Aquabacterium sp. A7-Y]|uniref:acyl carrier protein n=1 Tax=Aquabacterium sp. A7-Y TaxID=1349605 RepID=UPI00223D0097|nr:acyl carrier protein [Aquabacterium sp. A7-Y]MCW7539421.1 acyl carrier protein [Aquabacterium sp. A7-Y]
MDKHAETLRQQVLQVVAQWLDPPPPGSPAWGVPPLPLTALHLVDDLGLDSVQLLRLLTCLEQQFDIDLDDRDLEFEGLMQVQTLVEHVLSKAVLPPGESAAGLP